jgi:transposase
VAVAHSLLVVFYDLLKDKCLEYHELGGDYFDTLDPIRRRHLVKRLESLGYEVTLAERKAA